MISPELFSPDYSVARRRFREAATRLGWNLEAYDTGAVGPHGEQLTIDVARWCPNDSADGLVISSGLHGVEGFFGSAVQLGLLERWAQGECAIPPLNLVFLHGLNPFGFAWHRRFDRQNIDLNRNFLLPGESFEGSPAGYADLDDLLNPPRPPSRWDPFLLRALLAIAKNGGMPKLKQAVAEGQYEYPKGLFYGGCAPSRTSQVLAEHLPRWIGGSARVVHLDFHTGLRESGEWKLLIDYPLTDSQEHCLSDWFGPENFERNDPKGVAYQTRGSMGQWCVGMNRAKDYLYACAEFGTYGPIKVLASLRAENQAYHWGTRYDRATRRAKQGLLEAFCPRAVDWRTKVLEGGYRIVDLAIQGLTGQAPPPDSMSEVDQDEACPGRKTTISQFSRCRVPASESPSASSASGLALAPVCPAPRRQIPPAARVAAFVLFLLMFSPAYLAFYGGSDWFRTAYPAVDTHRQLAMVAYGALCFGICDTISRVASGRGPRHQG